LSADDPDPDLTGPALGMFEVFGQTRPPTLEGPPFWTLKPEMLQPDAFCEHTTQQNATAEPRWESLQHSPDHLGGFKGATSRRRGGRGEVDCDAQLEQGRKLAKAGPVT